MRNVYKDEAYLTHTLPVTKKQIYLSKILSAIITLLTSTVTIVICLLICYGSKENLEILKQAIQTMANAYDTSIMSFVATILTVLFLEILALLLSGYVGIIIGHKSNNIKILKSVIFGYLAYVIPQAITLLRNVYMWNIQQRINELIYLRRHNKHRYNKTTTIWSNSTILNIYIRILYNR